MTPPSSHPEQRTSFSRRRRTRPPVAKSAAGRTSDDVSEQWHGQPETAASATAPFESLPLRAELLAAVNDRGFTVATPIQGAVIPLAVAGCDIMACAETGSGKTAAFLLPILERLLTATPQVADGERRSTRALILVPTRELAAQIDDELQGFLYHTNLCSAAVYGGVSMDPQERALRAGADMVIATPGRLLDHMRTGTGCFDELEVLVLDEADRMLDMGFWPDVKRIVTALPARADGTRRQTLLFSATMPGPIARLAQELLHQPRHIQVGRRGAPAESITHQVRSVAAAEKPRWLAEFLRRAAGSSLVFVRTRRGAERLARQLHGFGVRVTALHADLTQRERTIAVERFRSGDYRVLVATDIAARGLDIAGIAHVVNFDVPPNREAYVHRVGRTGRADAAGAALTLVAPEELRAFKALEESFGLQLE